MTEQEIFDKVKSHLLSQGKKSFQGISCAYRGDDGLKCAIGCLISDENYSSSLEGWTVGEASVLQALYGSGLGEIVWTERGQRLMLALQSVHDDCDPVDWPTQLKILAAEHGLTP